MPLDPGGGPAPACSGMSGIEANADPTLFLLGFAPDLVTSATESGLDAVVDGLVPLCACNRCELIGRKNACDATAGTWLRLVRLLELSGLL